MKAFEANFKRNPDGRGRPHKGGDWETAIVIAEDVIEAVKKAEDYRKKNFPKLTLEEIRHEDDRVIQ